MKVLPKALSTAKKAKVKANEKVNEAKLNNSQTAFKGSLPHNVGHKLNKHA